MARRGAIDQDGLAALYSDGRRAKDPVSVAHKIEQIARTPGKLSSDVAASTALTMAAELCHEAGATAEAVRLAQTAIAWRAPDDTRASAPALLAVVLARSGRRSEGLTILHELRDGIGASFEATTAVPEALERIGERDLAIEWLTSAIHELSPRALGEGADRIDSQLLQLMMANRRRLRSDAGLEPDHLDVLATTESEADPDGMTDGVAGGPRLGRIALLYWPRPQFEAFARMWPDLAAGYGNGSWAGHRAQVEKMLQAYTEGGVRLVVVPAELDSFLDYTAEQGLDPKTAEARSAYAAELGRRGRAVAYPPAKGSACWCGSGRKFRRCCGGSSSGLVAAWSRLFG